MATSCSRPCRSQHLKFWRKESSTATLCAVYVSGRWEIGITTLEVYRAKAVAQPHPDPAAKIGLLVSSNAILDDLRRTKGVEPALGLAPGPGSGLTLRIPAPR